MHYYSFVMTLEVEIALFKFKKQTSSHDLKVSRAPEKNLL